MKYLCAVLCFSDNIATLNSEQNAEPSTVEKKPEKPVDKKDAPRPHSEPKFYDADSFATAQKRVQFLLSKLHNLLQIKVDLDQLLALTQEFGEATSSLSKGSSNIYQQMSQEIYFKVAVEKLMKKGKILEINKDVQVLLSRLRQLVQFQTSHSTSLITLYCDDKIPNPLHNKAAFLNFIVGRLDSSSFKFSCKNRLFKVTPVDQPLSPVTSQSQSKDDL